jgi:hypothetical protein
MPGEWTETDALDGKPVDGSECARCGIYIAYYDCGDDPPRYRQPWTDGVVIVCETCTMPDTDGEPTNG